MFLAQQGHKKVQLLFSLETDALLFWVINLDFCNIKPLSSIDMLYFSMDCSCRGSLIFSKVVLQLYLVASGDCKHLISGVWKKGENQIGCSARALLCSSSDRQINSSIVLLICMRKKNMPDILNITLVQLRSGG